MDSHGIFRVHYTAFIQITEENRDNFQSRQPVFGPRFQTGSSLMKRKCTNDEIKHRIMPRCLVDLLLLFVPEWLSRYNDSLRVGRSGDRIPVEARFPASLHTCPGTHPASCTMGNGSFFRDKAAGAWR